jgi:hypothetical protein
VVPTDTAGTSPERNTHDESERTAVSDYVTYHGDFEDAYRRSDSDEFGFLVPEDLIRRREEAEQALDAANDAIRRYITENDVPEVELFCGSLAVLPAPNFQSTI